MNKKLNKKGGHRKMSKKVISKSTDKYQNRFLELWGDIKDPKNGYFSNKGIPYHSIETLIIIAPGLMYSGIREAEAAQLETVQ